MDLIKKLTSKNNKDYEHAATHIVSCGDVEAFSELVKQDDFLFDFIKKNISNRLENAVNKENFRNLLKFLRFYSPSYDEFIAKSLAKYADEDLTDEMLELFEKGSDSVKAYCAKFFSYIKDSLALELLKNNAYSEFEPLALNCASTLAALNDRVSYDSAIEKLNSDDDFEKYSAVKFLTAYGDKVALDYIFKEMKKSSMSEHIAAQIPYLETFLELLNSESGNDALFAINLIIDGLGEMTSLSQVFDFQLFEVFEYLINNLNSKSAVVLLNAKNKFDILTENDEYIYDEDKNTKNEIFEIKSLLYSVTTEKLLLLAESELNIDSEYILSVIDFTSDFEKLLSLLVSDNPTVILKILGRLKVLNKIDLVDKSVILSKFEDEYIKAVIKAI